MWEKVTLDQGFRGVLGPWITYMWQDVPHPYLVKVFWTEYMAFWSSFFQTIIVISISSSLCVFQLCSNLCEPMNWSLPGFSVHGILQSRILGWVAMPSFRGSSLSLMSPALAGGIFITSATWDIYFLSQDL